MKNYEVIRVCGRQHIVCAVNNRTRPQDKEPLPDPNYQNTGKALCGVLAKGESLNEWKDRKTMRIKRSSKSSRNT